FRFSVTYKGSEGWLYARGEDRSFVTPPSVTTWTPIASWSLIGSEPSAYATLQGYVAVNGATVTGCRFEYGTSYALGLNVPCAQNLGASSGQVSARVSGLQWSTTYYARLSATDSGGPSYGTTQAFQTPTHVTYSPGGLPYVYTAPPVYTYTNYARPNGGARPYTSP